MTARPATLRQFSSRGSRETATMLPTPTPWYMAMTRSCSTSVVPEWGLSSGPAPMAYGRSRQWTRSGLTACPQCWRGSSGGRAW